MGIMEAKWDNIAPFSLMVLMEACTIALTIMAKTALTGGMSPFVFVVYTNALGSLLLLPYSHMLPTDERNEEPILTFPLVARMFFLGFTGVFLFQNLAFLGLSYSSPIVVCAMGLQLPAMSFLLSLVLGRTKIEWGNSMTQAKVIGTLVSFTGAAVEELYLGPYIRPSSSSSSPNNLLNAISRHLVFFKSTDNWVLGGLLLACASFSISVWNVIQLDTVRKYPQVMKVVSYYSLAGTVQCVIFSLFMERDLSAWRLQPNLDLLLIIVTGLFGSIIRTTVHVKCAKVKGPYYVPMFKPFGILWATIFGTSFFVDSLHYGSVIGAIIAGIGYLVITLVQIRESEQNKRTDQKTEVVEEIETHPSSSLEDHTIPLLRQNAADNV